MVGTSHVGVAPITSSSYSRCNVWLLQWIGEDNCKTRNVSKFGDLVWLISVVCFHNLLFASLCHILATDCDWLFFTPWRNIIPLCPVIHRPNIYTVKPVYNDHVMGYFSAFRSSSRWPRATQEINFIIEVVVADRFHCTTTKWGRWDTDNNSN